MTIEDAAARLREALAGHEPALVVLAGSNGAGKSTFYDVYLARLGLPLVSADLVSGALAIDDPVLRAREAAALADRERQALVERGEPFVTETVLSDPVGAKLAFLRAAQARGYAIILIFIGIASPALSALRVSQRTAAGGHGVPLDRIEARFPRTLANLREALRFVDVAVLFDNSSADKPFRFVARWEHGRRTRRGRVRPAWLPADLR